MEKIDREFDDRTDFVELDDVLDRSFFSHENITEDDDEDERYYEVRMTRYRSISEL